MVVDVLVDVVLDEDVEVELVGVELVEVLGVVVEVGTDEEGGAGGTSQIGASGGSGVASGTVGRGTVGSGGVVGGTVCTL